MIKIVSNLVHRIVSKIFGKDTKNNLLTFSFPKVNEKNLSFSVEYVKQENGTGSARTCR